MKLWRVLFFAALTVAFLSGCRKKEEEPVPQQTAAHPAAERVERKVVVPPAVQGKWKAVRIAISTKGTTETATTIVPIGGETKITGSDIVVKVDAFLPNFIMEGTSLTSKNNEAKNPAAQVTILEHGAQIFRGWLFELYPTTHSFQHPKYDFKLVGQIPAR